MPFTLSHPAAVLPFVRGPLVPAALVAGSLAPDVPYFLPAPRYAGAWYEPFVNATTTHHWPGSLTVAVPSAAVLLALWWLVRAPLTDLVVRAHGAGGSGLPAVPREVRALGWLVGSLVVGVLTHVVWDSFTHADGALVGRVALLREPVVAGLDVARVLQHVSTAVGGLVLVVWGVRRLAAWRAAGGRLGVTRGRAAVLGVLVVAAVSAAWVATGPALADGAGPEALLADAVKAGGAATVAAMLGYALLWHATAALRARPVSDSPTQAGAGVPGSVHTTAGG